MGSASGVDHVSQKEISDSYAVNPPRRIRRIATQAALVLFTRCVVDHEEFTLGEHVVTPSEVEGSAFPDTEFEKADSSLRSE